MTDNFACAKVAFLRPLKMQFRENPFTLKDRPLSGEYTTTFVFSKSHLTGEIFNFKYKYPIGKNNSHRRTNFPTGNI